MSNPPAKDLKSLGRPPRILIVRRSAIGDVVHVLPSLHLLREAYPEAFIGWIVEDFAAAYLDGHPQLNRLHIISKKKWRSRPIRSYWPEIRPFYKELRDENYDIAIDFQGLTKSGLSAWLSKAPRRIGFGDDQSIELNRLFINERVVPPPEAKHIIERNAALLAPLGISAPPETPVIHLNEEDRASARKMWADMELDDDDKTAGLNIGAGWPTKRWPTEHWAPLAKGLARTLKIQPILLWGSESERQTAGAVKTMAQASNVKAIIAPATTLRESAALIERLTVFFGGDTGATHVAAALGVPTVAIFGAADSIRNGAFGPRAVSLQDMELPCTPCWKGKCNYKTHLACLRNIKPEAVLEAAGELLGN